MRPLLLAWLLRAMGLLTVLMARLKCLPKATVPLMGDMALLTVPPKVPMVPLKVPMVPHKVDPTENSPMISR